MASKKKRRIQMLAGGAVLMIASVGLFGFLAQDAIAFFKSPTELQDGQFGPEQLLRVGGLVVQGSLRNEGTTHHFSVSDGNATVGVVYTGVLPDLFREGQGIVAQGYWRGGNFEASEVLAKHDENYMPREVVESLKAQGHFRAAE